MPESAEIRERVENAFVSLPVSEFEALSDALAWTQHKLRAFGYEADADEVLAEYGLTYVEPKPKVRKA